MRVSYLFHRRTGHQAGNSSVPLHRRLGYQPWHTGLFLLSSAALGGIAVALWNRRTLLALRRETEELPTPQAAASLRELDARDAKL